MFCPDCGHNNPAGNRFCGMCGERLPERAGKSKALRSPAEGPGPIPTEPAPAREEEDRAAQISAAGLAASEYAPPRGYGFTRHDSPPAETFFEEPPAPSSQELAEPPAEHPGPTTLSGPSFLGLSASAGKDGESYSYLLEDQEQGAHLGRWVGALILVVLAAVIYVKWQPLKTWAVNTAASHMRSPSAPIPSASTDDTTISNGNPPAPAATPTPAVSTQSAAPPVEQAVNPSASTLPQQDKDPRGTAANGAHANQATDNAAASDTKQTDSKANEGNAPAEKRTPAKKNSGAHRGDRSALTPERPAAPPGDELVNNGEKYLYGHGVARSCRQALTYFRAAAGQDNARAFSHLGALYATGECVPLDRVRAYTFFGRALANDRSNPYYEQNLTMLWRDMSPAERQRATTR